MHSLPINHHIYPIFFIHMSLAPLLPYALPANIILPFPDAKLSLANILSVTVLLGSGATSLSLLDLPIQSLSSNVISKSISYHISHQVTEDFAATL
jgi:hypothetical protein